MENSAPESKTLRTQRIVPCTPGEVFAAFADPRRLAKWWGPKDFTNTFETFEFKAGGDWKFVMHAPDGSNYQNASVFVEITAGTKIVVQHVSPPHFTLAISLMAHPAGTQILWVQEFDDPKIAAAMRHIAEPANEQNLDRLQMILREDQT